MKQRQILKKTKMTPKLNLTQNKDNDDDFKNTSL